MTHCLQTVLTAPASLTNTYDVPKNDSQRRPCLTRRSTCLSVVANAVRMLREVQLPRTFPQIRLHGCTTLFSLPSKPIQATIHGQRWFQQKGGQTKEDPGAEEHVVGRGKDPFRTILFVLPTECFERLTPNTTWLAGWPARPLVQGKKTKRLALETQLRRIFSLASFVLSEDVLLVAKSRCRSSRSPRVFASRLGT